MHLSLLLISSFFAPIYSFGFQGHYLIGAVTQHFLSSESIEYILSCSYLDDFQGDLGLVSLWADKVKRSKEYSWTRTLHYYDLPDDPPNTCLKKLPLPKNNTRNLLNGIFNSINVLNGNETNKKICSQFHFNMLTHLLQDLHQPLHFTGKEKGGNGHFFYIGKRKYNLHQFWDSRVIDIWKKYKNVQNITEYFINKIERTTKICFIGNDTPLLPPKNITNFILDIALQSSSENCNIVWNTDNQNYLNDSAILIESLLTRSILNSIRVFSFTF